MSKIEKTIEIFHDKSEMHRAIDELEEDEKAILVTKKGFGLGVDLLGIDLTAADLVAMLEMAKFSLVYNHCWEVGNGTDR